MAIGEVPAATVVVALVAPSITVIVPAARLLAPGGWIAFAAERDDVYLFHLTDSGRYAHHPDHIREVTTEAGLTVRQLDAADLRFEYGEPVTGLIAVLQGNRSGGC